MRKYEQIFDAINVNFSEKAQRLISDLEKEGYSQKGIIFAINKSQDKIISCKRHPSFWNILRNEIIKHTYKKNDIRWDIYRKEKEEQKERQLKQIEKDILISKRIEIKEKYPGFIYFIQSELGGAIKIGYSGNIKSRLASLQTGYPDKLNILGSMPGTAQEEKRIHNKLKESSLRGEWFNPTIEVMEVLSIINDLSIKRVKFINEIMKS